ncbi:hypothetical protein Ddye_000965 [Dipteronia dyeriana]|uniref:Reverse transcriptase zinc-binding domain-containing protein n=1 Tax=Dipteronia dyeriana TaxID=168575 RepID=A0AAD9XN68_9ROSI|nr:hypothetical protein Ddye_000965 [Dipteronia dyeriana]
MLRLLHNPSLLAAKVLKGCYFSLSSFLAATKDRWILSLSTFKFGSFPVLGEWAIVNSLKLPSSGWNKDLVNNSFILEEAEAILSLPPCSSGLEDSLLWHFDKSGSILVWSEYWVAKDSAPNPSCSGLNSTISWRKFFWRLHLPFMGQLFLWKTCNNWIPTQVNQALHGMQLELIFPMCLKRAETMLHALW